ncbi:serine/threonine-protein kinase RsbW [Maridesulfovibrio ferrireducens]|uniref:Serine/threonine-protein kinase RsbW n=1 Tax=Maridesulfovibrio ferrireducens TaxID=246191 RepID=A0A1G9JMC6_9BACT|nr:ATP-binding protein [Maridesulfovibrio ferrireducens]SDL38727.1 serine/threonine-protein kinase RsbW [Maridesulfovibrio ferrireducens]
MVNNRQSQVGDDKISSFTLKADLSELKILAEKIENFGQQNEIPEKNIFEVNLVLDELFTNLVSYGCFSDSHSFDIELILKDGVMFIEINDDGKPFNPLDIPEPEIQCDCDERRIGGLGIHFMRKMMDSIEYELGNGKNILKLTKIIQ